MQKSTTARWRRLIGLVWLATYGLAASTAAAESKPNIIVIVADDLGYGDIGVHGCKDIPTPNIDSIARAGVRCTSGYVSGPYCSPTRAGLLTGRYQQRFGHEFNPGPPAESNQKVGLSLKETTLPQRLKGAGYQTGMVGKWHLGGAEEFNPVNRGFDEFFGFLGGAHPYLVRGKGTRGIMRGTRQVDESGYLTDAFAREAVDYIDRHSQGPFFLYLTFNAVHTPMEATDKYRQRFSEIADPKRQTYAAMLSAMDDAIGDVLNKLRDLQIEENTLVFFISDNGGPEAANASNNGPLHGSKATTWEGGIRVPFLVQWKAKLPGGKTFDEPVIQLDILPTALAAAGVEVQSDWQLDGVNLLPHFTGDATAPPHKALYWRFGRQTAIRMNDWKLVRAREGGRGRPLPEDVVAPAALYNLKDDVGEMTDLSAEHPEKVEELRTAWKHWNAELVEPAWEPAAAKKAKQQQRAERRRRRAAAIN